MEICYSDVARAMLNILMAKVVLTTYMVLSRELDMLGFGGVDLDRDIVFLYNTVLCKLSFSATRSDHFNREGLQCAAVCWRRQHLCFQALPRDGQMRPSSR